jgi:hypothetical protein
MENVSKWLLFCFKINDKNVIIFLRPTEAPVVPSDVPQLYYRDYNMQDFLIWGKSKIRERPRSVRITPCTRHLHMEIETIPEMYRFFYIKKRQWTKS